jgi:hypothetical protein
MFDGFPSQDSVMAAMLCIIILLPVMAAPHQTRDPVAQLESVPAAVRRTIANGPLAKAYELSFHLNPFYLRGDFNGDGKVDHAVLVKHLATGKIGVAIVHGGSNKVVILGAGTRGGAGGDDFEWMDYWQVYPKGPVKRGVGERTVPLLVGEALLVGKSEAASGLIYWNGRKYVWYQQGD